MSENIEAAGNTEEASADSTPEISVNRKKVTFLDIVAVQAIMCLVAAIAFVGVNIFYPDLAADIFDVYLEKNTDSGNISNVIKAIADFLQSTPQQQFHAENVQNLSLNLAYMDLGRKILVTFSKWN